MRLAVRLVFGLLVIATFSAFFVAQRLKNSPPVLGDFTLQPWLSPNRDGRFDRTRVGFTLKESDTITVSVVDTKGDHVAELVSGRDAPAGVRQRFPWDGRTDAGAIAPDGIYRIRVTLQRQGRSIVVQRSTKLDTTPPRPSVVSIGPSPNPTPELLPVPDGGEVNVQLRATGRKPRLLLFKMAPGAPRLVDAYALEEGTTSWRWDGRLRDRRRASAGTYLVVAEVRDRAGNIGTSLELDDDGLPVTSYGAKLPGRGGITVRYVAVRRPLQPVEPGAFAQFFVDSRRERYTWRVRRVGSPIVLNRSGSPKTDPRLRFHAPERPGVYLLEVRAGSHRTSAPFVVQGASEHPVLVVMPALTWLGRAAVDDDGDGLPDRLDAGLPVRRDRMLPGDGLPTGFAQREAQVLGWLDRSSLEYDVTTDLALALGTGPELDDYRGILLPADVRWLPRATLVALRAWVRAGGTLATLGVDGLRRQVTVGDELLDGPTPASSTDAFGARLRPVRRLAAPITLVNASDSPEVELFGGTAGLFGGFSTLQELDAAPELLASATVQDPPSPRPTIAASRVGEGLVLRYPLPELPSRLAASNPDQQVIALLTRAWTLLSR